MLHKTRGIVIHNIKYSDSSLISHIYTEKFGRKSFMISGTRGKKSPVRINLLQHLSIIDMEVYIKQTRDLQKVKEIRLYDAFTSIPWDPVKNAVALFLSEILYRTLREEESNPGLFSFLINSIKLFDLAESGYANFHLLFMLGFSRHLGVSPQDNYSSENDFFDIENARFTTAEPQHPNSIKPPVSRILHDLMNCSFEDMGNIRLTSDMRNKVLSGLLDYFRYHMPGMDNIKSFAVLREVFD